MRKLGLPANQRVPGDSTTGTLSHRGLVSPTVTQIGTPNPDVSVSSSGLLTLARVLGTDSEAIRVRVEDSEGYAIEGPVMVVGDGTSNNSMRMGLNMGFVATYQGRAFANMMHCTFKWQRFTGTGAWSQDRGLLTAAVSTDRFRLYLYDGNKNPGWYPGTYTVRNPDGCRIAIGNFDNSMAYKTWTNETSFTVYISPGGDHGVFLFLEGSLTNNNGNLEIIAPGCVESYDAGNVWHPDFLSYIEACNPSTLRFMDWNVASHTFETDWSDRATISDGPAFNRPWSTTASTVPYELMFDLCERVGANPWICVPAYATDAWVTSFSNLAKDLIPAGKKLYVEYGNEIWNFSDPWLLGTMWSAYLYHTKRVATHDGAGNFTLAGHGFPENRVVRGFWTKANRIAGASAASDGWRIYSGGEDMLVHVIDANTFSMKKASNGVALNLPASIVDIMIVDTAEAGKVANYNLNYGKRSIEIWDIMDPIIGASRINHICGTMAAMPSVTSARMAAPGMAERVDAVAVAPYFSGDFWMGRVSIASGTITPAMYATKGETRMYVGVYATGSTPTEDDIMEGTGAGYVGHCSSISYAPSTLWRNGGGGLTAIPVTNGTVYDVHFVWEDLNGDRFRNSVTVTASATASEKFLADTPRDYRMRTEENIKYVRRGTYPQHSAASGGKPIICYETALGHSSAGAPFELETIMRTFMESEDAGECIKNCLSIIASMPIGESCYYSDMGTNTSFTLAKSYSDTDDKKFQAYTSLNGMVPRPGPNLFIPEQTVVGGQTAPGSYPHDLITFDDPTLTYYIYSGNRYGCYDIVGNKLRLINGNGTPWADQYARFVKVYATNGRDMYIFRVNANGGWWWAPNSVVHIDYDNDRARINGVVYDSLADAEAAGAMIVDGTHTYGPLTSALGSSYSYAFKGRFPEENLDAATACRLGSLDDGDDSNDTDARVSMGLTTPMRVNSSISVGGVTVANMGIASDYTAGGGVRAATRVKANDAALFINGIKKGSSATNTIPSGINTYHVMDRFGGGRAWLGTCSQFVIVNADLTDAQLSKLLM